MLRRSAKVLSLYRSLSSASNSSRLAERLPVRVPVPVAFQAVVPWPLQNCAQSAWLLTAKSACFFHTNHGLREVDLNYRYAPGYAVTKQTVFAQISCSHVLVLLRSPTEQIWPASPRQQKGDLGVAPVLRNVGLNLACPRL